MRVPDVEGAIPGHLFPAVAMEWADGALTDAQANAIFLRVTGLGLDSQEATDARTIVDTVRSIPVTGSQASRAEGIARRAMRIHQIQAVLEFAHGRVPPYDDPAFVRSRLGL